MIGTHRLAEAVIGLLKADINLTTYLASKNAPNEIREHSYQGSNSTYPAVRINIGSLSNSTTGNCAPNQGSSNIIIYTYSEKDSSYECDELTANVFEAIKNKRLDTSYLFSTVLVPTRIDHAQRESAQRRWRGTLTLSTTVITKEV